MVIFTDKILIDNSLLKKHYILHLGYINEFKLLGRKRAVVFFVKIILQF